MLSSQDLKLTYRQLSQTTTDRNRVDLSRDQRDLGVVTGRSNLAQALLNRLHTRQGELAALGHPDYGSRLYQLIGELNNSRTRMLSELYIRECLTQESRISEVVSVEFESPSRGIYRAMLTVIVIVQPVGNEPPLTLDLSLNLGG